MCALPSILTHRIAAHLDAVKLQFLTRRRAVPEPAHHIMRAAHNGKIYIFGGFTLGTQPKMSWQPTKGSWVYDPATDSYKPLAPLPRPRGAGYAVTTGDKIYVIGGVASNADASSSQPIPLSAPILRCCLPPCVQ
jgi:Kelch motif